VPPPRAAVFLAAPTSRAYSMNNRQPGQGAVSEPRPSQSRPRGPLRHRAGRLALVAWPLDDVVDATLAAWTAHRIAMEKAQRIPSDPPVDSRGLRMEMWL